MAFDDTDNPGLVLVLGLGFSNELKKATMSMVKPEQQPSSDKESGNLEPSLILSLSGEPYGDKKVRKDHEVDNLYRQDSVASSISHVTVKREREIASTTRVMMSDEDEDDDGSNARKKLRLTKAQSAMLEESFKHRNSLNPVLDIQKQKQELAKELNLRPRQVEVWFQNRRARTKLKQTEVDCEFLKKCCETLTEENRRLQKELQELKALKVANPFYNMPAGNKLTICPSCERIAGDVAGEKTSKSSLITMAPKHHLLNNPFANQSAAC